MQSTSKISHLNQQNTVYVGESTRAGGTAKLLVCTYGLDAFDFFQTYCQEEGRPQGSVRNSGVKAAVTSYPSVWLGNSPLGQRH